MAEGIASKQSVWQNTVSSGNEPSHGVVDLHHTMTFIRARDRYIELHPSSEIYLPRLVPFKVRFSYTKILHDISCMSGFQIWIVQWRAVMSQWLISNIQILGAKSMYISVYVHVKEWDAITHPCHLNLGQGRDDQQLHLLETSDVITQACHPSFRKRGAWGSFGNISSGHFGDIHIFKNWIQMLNPHVH